MAVNVQITHIFYDGQVPRVESNEYVEIINLGTEPVDLAGWVLKDISQGYPSLSRGLQKELLGLHHLSACQMGGMPFCLA